MTAALPQTVLASMKKEEREDLFRRALARARAVADIAVIDHVVPLEIDVWLPAIADWMEGYCRGCGEEMAAQALELATQMLNCRPLRGKVAEGYVAILAGYPADLLLSSVRACLAQERYHVMPTPGALCDGARSLYQARLEKLWRLKLAMARIELAARRRERLSRHYTPDYRDQLDRERSQRARKG
jgi:hypothetical protein